MNSNDVIEVVNQFTGTAYKKMYVDQSDLIEKPLWFHKRNLMQTRTGYGKNLKTEYMVRYNNKVHRIYYSNFSNSGTFYIKTKQGDIILDITF